MSVMQGKIFLMKYREHLVIPVLKSGADASCTLSHVLRKFLPLAIREAPIILGSEMQLLMHNVDSITNF